MSLGWRCGMKLLRKTRGGIEGCEIVARLPPDPGEQPRRVQTDTHRASIPLGFLSSPRLLPLGRFWGVRRRLERRRIFGEGAKSSEPIATAFRRLGSLVREYRLIGWRCSMTHHFGLARFSEFNVSAR